MIVVMESNATKQQINSVEKKLEDLGFKTHPIYGKVKTVIGAIGDKSVINMQTLESMSGVEAIVPIMKPYKLASKELKTENSIIEVDGVKIGGNKIVIIAGPCVVENEKELIEIAYRVKEAGAVILRGGAYKPRTSPYSFQGLEEEGLKMLKAAKEETGLKVITEVMDTRDVELVESHTDIIQIGARNMQNFRLLKEVGKYKKPVLLKRGLSATIEEWLMAAEYIISEGNPNIILCERGIRTFEQSTRNTIDISAVPMVKQLSHLPVVVDPSHGTGTWKLVNSVSKGLVAAGADGLLIEVHSNPCAAFCDGPQSLVPEKFIELMRELKPIVEAIGREM